MPHVARAIPALTAMLYVSQSAGGLWHLDQFGFPPPTESTPTVTDVVALGGVSGGQWVVFCPWCPTATVADPDVTRRHVCIECGNRPVDGAWIAVRWPDDPAAVEAPLVRRGDVGRWNWPPHEDVAWLWAENVVHGVHGLDLVPVEHRRIVEIAVAAHHEITPVHRVAPGVIVHPDSEWHPARALDLLRAMGANFSEDDARPLLYVYERGI